MTLPMGQQLRYWGVFAAVFLLLLWTLGDVIFPFLLGGAIAYMLDPIADWLERHGLSRVLATVAITLLAVLAFLGLVLWLVPTVLAQAQALIEAAPDLLQNLERLLTTNFPSLGDESSPIRQSIADIGVMIRERGGELFNTVLLSLSGIINVLLIIVIVPVVAFYLLLDWDRMVARVDNLLPREHAPTIRRLAREMDETLAGFVRGQGLVCLILGTYYAAALAAVGLQFGIVVGLLAGALTFIPYVGALVGGLLSIGLALVQFWGDWVWIVVVWAIFQSGQFVEGNILTPKLVGDSVGLHPVWLLFALAAFGALFGFVGLLVAVPVAAMLGVLTRFLIERYKQSSLYRGPAEPEP